MSSFPDRRQRMLFTLASRSVIIWCNKPDLWKGQRKSFQVWFSLILKISTPLWLEFLLIFIPIFSFILQLNYRQITRENGFSLNFLVIRRNTESTTSLISFLVFSVWSSIRQILSRKSRWYWEVKSARGSSVQFSIERHMTCLKLGKKSLLTAV